MQFTVKDRNREGPKLYRKSCAQDTDLKLSKPPKGRGRNEEAMDEGREFNKKKGAGWGVTERAIETHFWT